MAKNKTTETTKSVTEFINAVTDETKRNDSFSIIELIKNQTGLDPKMWGTSIVGFGSYHYKYNSGHEGEAPVVAFSPRKEAISLYLSLPADDREEFLQKFGKHKSGKGCIYIKKLADIDTRILQQMVDVSVSNIKNQYPS
ncbi:MAG: DUF1801 domain-containing protein [Ferruginibacter sp.]